jgi:hypothetical protein
MYSKAPNIHVDFEHQTARLLRRLTLLKEHVMRRPDHKGQYF